MATTKDENERQPQQPGALASGNTIVPTPPKGAAVTNDPNNAAKFAKVPNGIGGNPAATPKPVTPAASTPPAAAPVAAPSANVQQRAAGPAAPTTPLAAASAPSATPPAAGVNEIAATALPKSQQIANSMLMGPPSSQREVAQQGMLWRQAQSAEMNERYDAAGAQMAAEARAAATQRMNRSATRPLASPVAPPSAGAAALAAYDASNPMAPDAKVAGTAVARDGAAPAAPTAYSAGAGRGSINPPLADPSKPPPIAADQSTGNAAPNWDRTGMTNAQVAAANPSGKVTMQRQANGTMSFSGGDVSGPVSYADGAGNPLAGGGIRGNGFSRVDSAPAGAGVGMDGSGNYAFSSNPIVATAGGAASSGAAEQVQPQTTQAAQAQTASSAQAPAPKSGGSSPAVDAALAAAAARGDWDAVRSHYAGANGSAAMTGTTAQPGFTGVIGQRTDNGNMWGRTPEQQRRDAEVQASSIHKPTAERGAAAMKALDTQGLASARNQNELVQEAMRQQGAMQRDVMRESGENYRAGNRNALVSAELAQRGREADSRARLSNIEVAKAERNSGILQRYDAAKTDADRAAIMRQHPDVFGVKAGEQADWRVQVTPSTKNIDGSTTAGSIVRYNQRTGQVEPVDVGANHAGAPNKELGDPKSRPVGTVSSVNGKTATWDGAKWVPSA